MKYTPFNKTVIIKQVAAQRATASGIILTSTQGADTAEVIAAQPDSQAKVGDKLIVRWPNALKIDGDVYAIDEKDVVCKIE